MNRYDYGDVSRAEARNIRNAAQHALERRALHRQDYIALMRDIKDGNISPCHRDLACDLVAEFPPGRFDRARAERCLSRLAYGVNRYPQGYGRGWQERYRQETFRGGDARNVRIAGFVALALSALMNPRS